MKLKIDGVKLKIVGPTLSDIDDEANETDNLLTDRPSVDNSQTEIREGTELGEALKELNNDEIEPGTRMSGIDMRSNLRAVEISSLLAIDTLVGLRTYPISILSLTRQKKRLANSEGGRGRNDIVDVVAGKRSTEAATGSSFVDRFKSLWAGGKNKQ